MTYPSLEAQDINADPPAVAAHFECDSCGYNMSAYAVGMRIKLAGEHPERDRLVAMFGKDTVNICFCCVAKAMGVKPVDEDNQLDAGDLSR